MCGQSLALIWKTVQSEASHIHRMAVYCVRPFYMTRYLLLLALNILFIYRSLFVTRSVLLIVQFVLLVLTTCIGECMSARYSAVYSLSPLVIDKPWETAKVLDHHNGKHILYEAELWITLFSSNLLTVLLSFTKVGRRGLSPLLFLGSISISFAYQILLPYLRFTWMGYNKGLIHCISDSQRYVISSLASKWSR